MRGQRAPVPCRMDGPHNSSAYTVNKVEWVGYGRDGGKEGERDRTNVSRCVNPLRKAGILCVRVCVCVCVRSPSVFCRAR